MTYNQIYRWRKYRPDLYGQRCRVLARSGFFRKANGKPGGMNSVLVEFEGGARHVVSRYAVRKTK